MTHACEGMLAGDDHVAPGGVGDGGLEDGTEDECPQDGVAEDCAASSGLEDLAIADRHRSQDESRPHDAG